MIRLSCSLKWLAIREYLWPRNEGDYGRKRGGGRGGELESLVVFFIGCVVFFMTALCVQDGGSDNKAMCCSVVRFIAVLSPLLLPCAGV